MTKVLQIDHQLTNSGKLLQYQYVKSPIPEFHIKVVLIMIFTYSYQQNMFQTRVAINVLQYKY